MVASIDSQFLLRLKPYPMRGHRLLCYANALSILTSVEACIGRQQETGRQTGIPCMLTTCAPLVIQMREAGC